MICIFFCFVEHFSLSTHEFYSFQVLAAQYCSTHRHNILDTATTTATATTVQYEGPLEGGE